MRDERTHRDAPIDRTFNRFFDARMIEAEEVQIDGILRSIDRLDDWLRPVVWLDDQVHQRAPVNARPAAAST